MSLSGPVRMNGPTRTDGAVRLRYTRITLLTANVSVVAKVPAESAFPGNSGDRLGRQGSKDSEF
jgi:hypothetical protein